MSETEVQSYRDLKVWRDSMNLAEACYWLTGKFPREELFGLTSQIRRASTSIPANIAEGNGRELTRSYVQSLRISQGSLKELETHLLLSSRVGLIDKPTLTQLLIQCESLGKMLRVLIRTLQNKLTRN